MKKTEEKQVSEEKIWPSDIYSWPTFNDAMQAGWRNSKGMHKLLKTGHVLETDGTKFYIKDCYTEKRILESISITCDDGKAFEGFHCYIVKGLKVSLKSRIKHKMKLIKDLELIIQQHKRDIKKFIEKMGV